jgi:hypothetical protein
MHFSMDAQRTEKIVNRFEAAYLKYGQYSSPEFKRWQRAVSKTRSGQKPHRHLFKVAYSVLAAKLEEARNSVYHAKSALEELKALELESEDKAPVYHPQERNPADVRTRIDPFYVGNMVAAAGTYFGYANLLISV